MIKNYSRPQSVIRQNLEVLDLATPEDMSAFIFGPAYSLHRYTNEAERSELQGSDFVTVASELEYEGLGLAESVVEDYVKIYGEDLLASIVSYTGGEFNVKSTTEANVLHYDESITAVVNGGVKAVAAGGASATTVLDTNLRGRDVQVGDKVHIENVDTGEVRKRTVTAVEPAQGPASVGEPTNYPANVSVASDISVDNVSTVGGTLLVAESTLVTLDATEPVEFTDNNMNDLFLAEGTAYSSKIGDRFTVTCTATGAGGFGLFSIRSASGKYIDDEVLATASGSGVTYRHNLTFDINDSGKGFTISINPTSNGDETWQKDEKFVLDVFGTYDLPDLTVAGDPHVVVTQDYTGSLSTTYFLKVKTGAAVSGSTFTGAELEVYDSAGLEVITTISDPISGTAYNLGALGVTFTIYDAGLSDTNPAILRLKTNEVYTVAATPPAKTATTTEVILDGNAFTNTTGLTPTAINVSFFKAVNGEIPNEGPALDEPPFTPGQDSVAVTADLKVLDSQRDTGYEWLPLVDAEGSLFVHYKALKAVSATDEIELISTTSDINEFFGVIDPENTLAYGLSVALQGANGKSVYGAAVATDDEDGYSDVLRKAENTDDLYALAPLSYDSGVQNLVATHVQTMSTSEKKQWRRAYVSTDTSDGAFRKVNKQSDGSNHTCTVTDDGNGVFRKVYSETANFVDEDIKVGDTIRLNFRTLSDGSEAYDEAEIALVVGDDELLLKDGLVDQVFVPVRFEAWAADSGQSQAERVAATSSSFADRRVVNVWCDAPEILIDGEYVRQEIYFLAANIAGLRSALLPQQGLTYTEIGAVSRIPNMYTKYTQEELDIAAAAGTFIITQERKNGAMFIRHQLTTETDKGSLYYEDSVGTNVDQISYEVKALDLKYIGKKNATPDTVRDMKVEFENLMINKTTAPTFQDIGPQLIEIFPGSLQVAIDPVFKDQINRSVKASIPLPLNRVETDLNFTTTLS